MIRECQVKEDPDKKKEQTCSAGNLLTVQQNKKANLFNSKL